MRIKTKPDSVVASTFLPKFCHQDPFVDVAPKNGNSWIWKSLLIERDVCIKGLDTQIWSGQLTSLYGDLSKRQLEPTNCIQQLIFLILILGNLQHSTIFSTIIEESSFIRRLSLFSVVLTNQFGNLTRGGNFLFPQPTGFFLMKLITNVLPNGQKRIGRDCGNLSFSLS